MKTIQTTRKIGANRGNPDLGRLFKAAPDLLDALEEIKSAIGGGGEVSESTLLVWRRIASAAIAKAKGEV